MNLYTITYKLIATLKAARLQKELTQQSLAQKMEVPQSYISKIEGGRVNLQLSNFIEIARHLDLEVMLIPRSALSAVKSMISEKESEPKPAYRLENEEDD